MGDVAKETVQEVGQEGVTIGGVQAANKLEKGEWAYDLDEVTDRLKDTAAHSALSFGILNMPAGARNAGGMKVDPFLRGLSEDAEKEVDHSRVAKDDFLRGHYESDDDALPVSENDWKLRSIDKRATIKLQNGIACFADDDDLIGNIQKVAPIKGSHMTMRSI